METLTKKAYTYEEYAQLPEGAPYQLIGGELIMAPAPTPYHQRILTRLLFNLMQFVEEQGLGEVIPAPIDVFLSEEDTPQPDLIYIASDRLGIIGEKKIEGAPDLIMEILSPSTAYYDLKDKKRLYEAHGVKEYWIIDPKAKEIEVYKNKGQHFQLTSREVGEGMIPSSLLNGFTVDLSAIF
ncbi:MAG TPA: Uma2 family endonuclease [Rhodothermales bacterium]|nr:Uma2 family endonuclease [Rhodothermales bacterium]